MRNDGTELYVQKILIRLPNSIHVGTKNSNTFENELWSFKCLCPCQRRTSIYSLKKVHAKGICTASPKFRNSLNLETRDLVEYFLRLKSNTSKC